MPDDGKLEEVSVGASGVTLRGVSLNTLASVIAAIASVAALVLIYHVAGDHERIREEIKHCK